MNARSDGGPAFPYVVEEEGCETMVNRGMSLRDWFAGQVLVGCLANQNTYNHDADPVDFANRLAVGSYCVADAMLAARSAK
jgi:hypothetical protein